VIVCTGYRFCVSITCDDQLIKRLRHRFWFSGDGDAIKVKFMHLAQTMLLWNYFTNDQ